MSAFRIQVLATGGTLAKQYDPHSGQLVVANALVDDLLAGLWLPDVAITCSHVLALDSLDMTAADRHVIVDAVRACATQADAIIIVHGTDTLSTSSALLAQAMPELAVPVVFTGAMVPQTCAGSDARQNLAQAIMACRLLAPGVHVVLHGRSLDGAHAVKNYTTLTFEPQP